MTTEFLTPIGWKSQQVSECMIYSWPEDSAPQAAPARSRAPEKFHPETVFQKAAMHEAAHVCVGLALGLHCSGLLVHADGEGHCFLASERTPAGILNAAAATAAGVITNYHCDVPAECHASDLAFIREQGARYADQTWEAMPDPFVLARATLNEPAVCRNVFTLAAAIQPGVVYSAEDITRILAR